jgi:predicted RNase H-like nuclease (RuvC/YqgF family)
MTPKISHIGWAFALCLFPIGNLMAQPVAQVPVKPTGPAAKKAEELIKAYTARIEKEIDQGRKEVERLRSELHELIDVRCAMSEAIADLRGELATKGTYSADFVSPVQATQKPQEPAQRGPMRLRHDFVFGLGSALPKEPTQEQREQLRRLAPRDDLKRMIERLRAEVDETRAEVDQLALRLLELSAGVPSSFQGMGGPMRARMDGMNGEWFGTMGRMTGGMM